MKRAFFITRFFGKKLPYFQSCLNIRRQVFVIEQNIPEELEADQFDDKAYHVLLTLYDASSAAINVATARWRITEEGIKLERFAVLPEYRNRGYGKLILDYILNDTQHLNKKRYLHAQDSAKKFYLKNNFKEEGEPFYEANILHYKMVYQY